MRELILKMFISVDGFVSSTDGDNRWMINPDLVAKAWAVEKTWDASLIVVGSRTFAGWAGFWPIATDEFAAPMNRIPKAVFSKEGPAILEAARAATDKARAAQPDKVQPGAESWANAYVASGDLAAEVAKLKAQDGKPMVAYGGASFARSLIAHNLVDQFDLAQIPVVLGQGLPIFDGLTESRRLTVISSKAFPKGTVVQSYRVA
jgi:dihydrofolate reductase